MACGLFFCILFFSERSGDHVDEDGHHRHRSAGGPGMVFDHDSPYSSSSDLERSSSPSSKKNPSNRYSTSRSDEGDDAGEAGSNGLGGRVDDRAPEVEQRKCVPFQVDFCRQLPYNFTSFPNAMGHTDVIDAKHDIERFK